MFSVAIVDDENTVNDTLSNYLLEYSKQNDVNFSIDYYENPVNFIESFTSRFDLIFLDIEMPLIDGLNLAHKIRERDEEVSIVFVTNMKQYVIRGYEVDADDFILKPVTYEDFSMKLDRVIKKILTKKDVAKVKVSDGCVTKLVSLSDICYIEVFQHKLSFHAIDKVYESRGSLNKIEPLFLDHNFARCNNYCLVNLKYVVGVDDYTLLVSVGKGNKETEKLTISRLRKKVFLSLLNKYLGVNA